MIRMYCVANHRGPADVGPDVTAAAGALEAAPADGLCPQCAELLAYSKKRIERCRFGDEKPTCARCTVHCYRADMRERIREVMRYSGPRMTLRHPYLALAHLLDRRRTPDER